MEGEKIIQSMPAFDTHGAGGAFEKVSLSIVFPERFSIILNGLDAVSSLFALSSPRALEFGPFLTLLLHGHIGSKKNVKDHPSFGAILSDYRGNAP